MSEIKTGGPAFPVQDQQVIHAYAAAKTADIKDTAERDRAYLKARAEAIGGMSLRDYFAAKAMQGLLASQMNNPLPIFAAYAYEAADEMLKAREKAA